MSDTLEGRVTRMPPTATLLVVALPTSSRKLGGELEKNRQLWAQLNRLDVDVTVCNVADWRRRPLSTALGLVRSIPGASQVVISVSTSGLFPLLLSPLGSVLAKKRVCVLAIGGILDNHVAQLKWPFRARVERLLHCFDVVAVESAELAGRLCQMGYANAMYLPNFRARSSCHSSGIPAHRRVDGAMRCVFLSRVTPAKGIRDAIDGVLTAQARMPAVQFSLDIYGPLDGFDPAEFLRESISYKGVVAPEAVVDCLVPYDIMLFPTRCQEGVPGVLIDAFFAGLPVIAAEWRFGRELIRENVNGYLVPMQEPAVIADKLMYLAVNPDILMRLREGALLEASRYDSALVVPQLLAVLSRKGWQLSANQQEVIRT